MDVWAAVPNEDFQYSRNGLAFGNFLDFMPLPRITVLISKVFAHQSF